MHPIERLRFVARATGAPADSVLREAAGALAGFADDPVALVTACRRLVDRHPANGPVWWLAARVLHAVDPIEEAWACVDRFDADPTLRELANALPQDATVCVVGWPPRLADAFARRGDITVRVIDVEGDGPGFTRALEDVDVPALDIDITGLGSAAASADLVVLDASAVGPESALAAAGSWPLAAVARTAGAQVWLVGGVGRTVSARTWPALHDRVRAGAGNGWSDGHDRVPLDLVDRVFGPTDDATDAPELQR